jgi:hypothetical protein
MVITIRGDRRAEETESATAPPELPPPGGYGSDSVTVRAGAAIGRSVAAASGATGGETGETWGRGATPAVPFREASGKERRS